MKELGEYLKETRKANGVSIEEAADDLKTDSFLIENLEEGNVRAFKDMLSMKEVVKDYAKYLGLNPEEVIDEFNDFMFEHTSKISLEDILEADKTVKKEKKVSSPYTIVKKKRINKRALCLALCIVIFLVLILIIGIYLLKPDSPKKRRELLGYYGGAYEFTNKVNGI